MTDRDAERPAFEPDRGENRRTKPEQTVADHSAAPYVPALAYHWLTPLYDRVVAATTREREAKRALIVQAAIRPEHVVLDLASGPGTLALYSAAKSG